MKCKGCKWWKDKHPAHPSIFKGQSCEICGKDTTNPWFIVCYPSCENPFLRYSRDETRIKSWNELTEEYEVEIEG